MKLEAAAATFLCLGSRASALRLVTVARPSALACSQGQEDQEQSNNQTDQPDGEPRPAARHEAPLDETGALTNPYGTDQDSESADDHGDGTCNPRCHVCPRQLSGDAEEAVVIP
jgi:hypothetical protein